MTPEEAPEAAERGFNLPERHEFWRDVLLPRLVLPLFWISWVILLPAWIIGTPARRRRRHQDVRLAIEAGRVGWTQVFFEELIASAADYVGADRVVQQVIDRDEPYVKQFRANQRRDEPTHVVCDVRTPGQSWGRSLVEAIAVSWLMLVAGRTAVVILPDAFYRRLRWHAACLTAYSGVVLTFVSTSIIKPIFPHRRVVGPLPMPVSRARVAWLEELRAETSNDVPSIHFIGHYYPPRSTLLEAVADRLRPEGIELTINPDKWGTSNEAYWRTLASADIVITTCLQGPERPFGDWMWTQQLVFRFNEALAAGAALVAGRVEGAGRYFVPGVDFLEFVSLDEAADAVRSLVRDDELRHRVAAAGHAKSVAIATEQSFWQAADVMLSFHPLTVHTRGVAR